LKGAICDQCAHRTWLHSESTTPTYVQSSSKTRLTFVAAIADWRIGDNNSGFSAPKSKDDRHRCLCWRKSECISNAFLIYRIFQKECYHFKLL
jgi:hypothetical protein